MAAPGGSNNPQFSFGATPFSFGAKTSTALTTTAASSLFGSGVFGSAAAAGTTGLTTGTTASTLISFSSTTMPTALFGAQAASAVPKPAGGAQTFGVGGLLSMPAASSAAATTALNTPLFGSGTNASSQPKLAFGLTSTTQSNTAAPAPLTFGSASTTSQPTFGLTTTTQSSTAAPAPLTFGSASTASQPTFGLTTTTQSSTAAPGSLTFGSASSVPQVAANSDQKPPFAFSAFSTQPLSFGNSSHKPVVSTGAPTSTLPAQSISANAPTATATSASAPAATTAQWQLGTSPSRLTTATTATTSFSAPIASTSLSNTSASQQTLTTSSGTAASGKSSLLLSSTVGLTMPTAATAQNSGAALASFGKPPESTATSAGQSAQTGTGPSAAVPGGSADGSKASQPTTVTYRQLEELINGWSAELEQNESVFYKIATEMNTFDRALLTVGDRVIRTTCELDSLRTESGRIEQELDAVDSQQNELERALDAIETRLRLSHSASDALPIGTQPQQNEGDPNAADWRLPDDAERASAYQNVALLDDRVRSIVDELRELVDGVNALRTTVAANSQDDDAETVETVTRILNSHVTAMQFIDENTALLERRIDNVARALQL